MRECVLTACHDVTAFLIKKNGGPVRDCLCRNMFHTHSLSAHAHLAHVRLLQNTRFAAHQMRWGPPHAQWSLLRYPVRTQGVAQVVHHGSKASGGRSHARICNPTSGSLRPPSCVVYVTNYMCEKSEEYLTDDSGSLGQSRRVRRRPRRA